MATIKQMVHLGVSTDLQTNRTTKLKTLKFKLAQLIGPLKCAQLSNNKAKQAKEHKVLRTVINCNSSQK